MLLKLFLSLKDFLYFALHREQKRLLDAGFATIYRGRLIPVMRGGAQEPGMFPALPSDLASLTDDELSTLLNEFREVARAVKGRDEDTLGDRTAEQIIAEMTAGVEAIEAITAEQTTRVEAEQNFERTLEEAAARAGLADDADTSDSDDSDDSDSDDQPAASEEARELEPVAAAATDRVRRPLPAAGRHKPTANVEPEGAALLASSAVYPHAEPGERLSGQRLAEVQSEVINKQKVSYGQKVIVASVTYDYPQNRYLGRDFSINSQRIADAVPGFRSLTASGGLCAPLTPIYSMPDVETADRPVRDALANFRADRGGVIVPENPVITDYADAVGVVTAAQDEAGGTFGVKTCMRIECPTFSEVQVDAIYRCVEIGNLTGRAYPELLSRVDTLVMANWARAADGKLLDEIRAGSTITTGINTANAGAVWEFFGHMIVAAAGMRSRHRMSRTAVLQALAPEWLLDLLQLDVIRQPYEGVPTRGMVEDFLGRAGINITFYKDGPSHNVGQVFGAQSAGNLLVFPTDVQWAIYPAGSWLHLDSGSLDLGIVRDSTLNSTNDYQIFAESWEQAAFIGVESLWVTSTICPNGTLSAPKDLSAVCTA